ncbi:dihydroneopterin aldolase family protein [Haladaptatus salinisoli]|uniref:dihydroneopterin aldolase family protein n=1 Tax=Haladaptatus salinisoli TaxID=2884876 RepID=UPI001D09C95F|nr:dihydroneopterin aldolase family protein [Haladaptatus salinisoli]
MEPTARDAACFEAGIKFGALYHQFAGTPVSPESAPSLERAVEESIENQPFCESVSVDILTEKLAAEIDHGYTELTGRFMEVEIAVEREGTEVVTRMAMEDGYPLMKIESVRED